MSITCHATQDRGRVFRREKKHSISTTMRLKMSLRGYNCFVAIALSNRCHMCLQSSRGRRRLHSSPSLRITCTHVSVLVYRIYNAMSKNTDGNTLLTVYVYKVYVAYTRFIGCGHMIGGRFNNPNAVHRN